MTAAAMAPTGDKLKAMGQRAVIEHDKAWKERALDALKRFAEWRQYSGDGQFTMDEFRQQRGVYVGDPNHENSWGALPRAAVSRGIIAPTDKFRKAQRAKAHSRMVKVWAAA